jgi:hypothetical protein
VFGDRARLVPVAGIECGLAAAGLALGIIDFAMKQGMKRATFTSK